MNYRYIILWAGNSGFGSGIGDDFDRKFTYNTWFISNYLSLRIRKLHIPTDGSYNMLFCNITKEGNCVKEKAVSSLSVNIHVEDEEIKKYLNMSNEVERFEYYLSLLERGYEVASAVRNIPVNIFLKLHQDFRASGYKNERLFAKKAIRDLGLKIELYHELSSYCYNLVLFVYNMHGDLICKDSIYKTFPDDIYFNKNVRHLIIENSNLVVTDFLDKPQFVCSLKDLCQGVIKSKCVDENTKKYIPNEENRAIFERLKW